VTHYNAIIFDMDGVLADTEPLHAAAVVRTMAAHGVRYVPGHADNFFGLTDDEVFGRLRARYGLQVDVRALSGQCVAEVVAAIAAGLAPLPGVPRVLETLRAGGYRLALASGSAAAVIEATLAALGIAGLFEVVVSGKEVRRGKPAPDVFLETARRLAMEPHSCLVVEDSGNGLAAARAAGMPCVVIPCGATLDQDFTGADVTLRSLEHLPTWLPPGPRHTSGLRTHGPS